MKIFKELEQKIVDLMAEFKIPGLAIGIVNDGKAIYAKGFGARNLEKNLPFTEDTLFGIGSISKSFTVIALLQLVEQGKISLQDPVNKYLDFKLGDENHPIRISHLLSHSSGIPELSGNVVAIVRQLGNFNALVPMSSWNDFMLHVNGAFNELFDKPDKVFFYNNDMFTCTGLIIEKLTNMKFEDYIKENILKPLEMNRSTYLKQDFERDVDVLTGYIPLMDKQPYKATQHPFDKTVYAPGGLLSSVKEMQNYIMTLLNGGLFNSHKILDQNSLEQMWKPYIKIPEETYGSKEASYGFGWKIEKNFFGYELIEHGGDIGSSTAFLTIIPEKRMGVIIGANCNASIVLGSLAHAVLGILLNKKFDETALSLVVHEKLKSLIGEYRTYKSLETMKVSFEEGILYTEIKESLDFPKMKLPLAPENLNELKFYVPIAYPNRKIKIQFFIDEKTEKVHFIFDRYYYHKI
ncbi:MAG: serine hydrolase [Promethearchaeota archaeon]